MIAVIVKGKTLPLMNADDTDRNEKVRNPCFNRDWIAHVYANLGWSGMMLLKSTPIWDGYREG